MLTWTAVGLNGEYINALAIDPANTASVYAAVGDGFGWGIYKTTTGGGSWPQVYGGAPHYALAIDPVNTNTVYAGEAYEPLKTINSGGTWVKLQSIGASDHRAIAIDPTNTSTVYVGVSFGWGVYKTINGGAAFTNVLLSTYATSLAIIPITTSVLYAGAQDGYGLGGGVYKTSNGGTGWTKVMTYTQVNALAINPLNPNVIYAGTEGGGIYKSTNGGANWNTANTGLTHLMVRALAIDPSNPNVVYAGTWEGGVFQSTNAGGNWAAINSGLTNTYILSLAIDPTNPSVVYAGTEGGGVFKLTSGDSTPTPMATPTGQTAVLKAFLPLALKNFLSYFEGPFEVEDNDSYLQANGPLRSGQDYMGYPDDAKDYFSIVSSTSGNITVSLSNHTGLGVQLQLFYQSVSNLVAFDLDAPYQINHSGPAGTYYIYIFTESGFNIVDLYTLRVTFP